MNTNLIDQPIASHSTNMKRYRLGIFKRDIVLPFVVTRLVLMVIAWAAMVWLPSVTGSQYTHISPHRLIDVWHRWDAEFYTKIALYGYGWQVGLRSGDATFMPLYPTLISLPLKLMPQPTRVEAATVGVLISNGCLLGALFYFDALLSLDHTSDRRRRLAIWLFLVAPTTIFFSAIYTESLFFLLSLMAVYYSRRGRWVIAGLAAFLAAMTRVMGWTLVFVLLWEAWHQSRDRWSWRSIGRGAAALASLLPVPIYAGVVGLALGAPGALFEITQAVWGQGAGAPWRVFTAFFKGRIDFFGNHSLIDLLFLLIFIALALAAFRWRISYGLYGLAIVAFPAWAGTLMSMPRYGAVGFPYYAVLAQWIEGHRWRTSALLLASALIAAYFAARFATWQWVA